MNHEHDDVIMFPVWRQQLVNESLMAVKHKNYEEALIHIEKLETFHEATNEILTAKIICLIELNRYEEAIRLCRKLMREDEENYFKYLHIYLSILFQTSQYSEVVDLLDEIKENESIPEEYAHSYDQIYNMSKQFLSTAPDESSEHIDRFIDTLESGNFQEQWKLLSIHRQHSLEPHLKQITPYLADTNLNPVIKTGILQWCMDEEVDVPLEIEKFGKNDLFKPSDLVDILETSFALSVLKQLEDIEQSDPTRFIFIKQILYRFLYIYFPYTPDEEDCTSIAEAVSYLASKYLQLDEKKLNQYISESSLKWAKKIENLEKKYFSQIEV
ncbi:hypothetical protein ACLIA0_08105 [Bacillaceae bacterium W0354]